MRTFVAVAVSVSLVFTPAALARRAEASRLTAAFAAMTGPGWTGADAAWSARLPDGRDVWLFGDTFLGGVDSAGRRDQQPFTARNSMVVADRDGTMRTVTGGSSSAPDSLVPGSGSDDWFWPGPPVAGRATLQVPMAHIVRTGDGGWDFKAAGTSLAVFDERTLELQSVTPVATPAGVNMASAAVTSGCFTYLYGTRTNGIVKEAVIARAPARNLSERWSYWTGSEWTADPDAAVPVASGVSDQFSVVHRGRSWFLLTQVPMSRAIIAFKAQRPQGPWSALGQIAEIPEIPHAMTYNAIVHGEYSRGRRLTIGYSVNGETLDWVYADAALYRPRFMTVRI